MLKFKKQVWKKAKPIYGEDPNVKRRDSSGKIIEYKKYGHFYSIRGWEIDHIIPKEHCGTNELYNLQPLKCSINRQWKSKLSIDKPGMTDQLFDEATKEISIKKNNDSKYNKRKLVNIGFSRNQKNWIKKCNDGNNENWIS